MVPHGPGWYAPVRSDVDRPTARSPDMANTRTMRLIIAILRPAQVESVRQALADIQVTRMTICDAQGYDLREAPALAQEVVMEIACNDDFVTRTVEQIAAATGSDGGDRLFVLPVVEAVQMYRDVRGPEAI
jgi:nitrogen regulatory protein PII